MPQASSSITSRLILGAILVAVAQAAAVRPAAAAADSPTVVPATGGGGIPLINGGVVGVDAIGYDTAEFLISGDARSYTTAASLTSGESGTPFPPLRPLPPTRHA